MGELLHIDGAYGEGGGQILRTALTLACITGAPFEIENLRAGRKSPGLAPQHLTAVRAAVDVVRASVQGDRLRSTRLRFEPGGPPEPGAYAWDVSRIAGQGSAGAVTLIAQTVLLPLLLAGGRSTLTIEGGTHVPFSPSAHYLQTVFLPAIGVARLVGVEVVNWGWYPRGGGTLRLTIDGPAALRPLDLAARGALSHIEGEAVVTNLPAHIPQRMADRARGALRSLDAPLRVEPVRARGGAPGAGIFLTAVYANARAGFAALGRKGKPSERVAEEACAALLAHHATGAAADLHLADQLVVPCALAAGRSVISAARLTAHLETNVHVVRQFLPGVEIVLEGRPGHLEIVGQGRDV
jgi:RNA 3'-terminal phosphate cyclase (ATP)